MNRSAKLPSSVPPPYRIPELTEINRLPMHGCEFPYADIPSAMRRKAEESPWVLSLDGKWDFSLYRSPEEVPEDFADAAFRSRGRIQVPSHWTLGDFFDKPIYTNIRMPAGFPPPPDVPAGNPTGIYRKKFRIPAAWKNRRVVLHVGGAESYLEVYLNGAFVGMGKDSRLASEFDLTPFLKKGVNLLVCKVIRWSDSSFVEDQDQWWMAGIYRSVRLYSTPKSRLEDIFVNGDFEEGTGRGIFMLRAHAAFQGEGAADEEGCFGRSEPGPAEDFRIEVRLYGARNRMILREELALSHEFRESGYVVERTFGIDNVSPWSAESPTLYTAVVCLLDREGKMLDCRGKRVGFRNIRIEGCDLLFNGRRVLIRGVNRHEHSMTGGKTLTVEEMIRDIRLLKQFNFNAVRASHYPDDPRWYDLCDEYGIYVLDEANLEAHACYASLCRDPRWRSAWVSRGERMVLRDRSHACIFGWSVGNESGNGENHEAEIRAIRRLDRSRIIHHEGELKESWRQGGNGLCGGRKEINQLYDPMYPNLKVLERYSDDPRTDRPCILCEYSHAMGNSCGSLDRYWELFLTKPKLQGGFIWDWIDQGLLVRGRDGKKMLAYGGDFGETRHDFDFCCNGMIASDRQVHPAMYEFRHLAQPVKVDLEEPAALRRPCQKSADALPAPEPVLPGAPSGIDTEAKAARDYRAIPLSDPSQNHSAAFLQCRPLRFFLENRRDFSALEDLEGTWRLQVDGRTVAEGTLPDFASLAPGKRMSFSLPLPAAPLRGREAFLGFRFAAKRKTPWCEAGTLLAHDQLELTRYLHLVAEAPRAAGGGAVPALTTSKRTFSLRSGDAVVAVDRLTGEGSVSCGGKRVLTKLFSCDLFRAGTDNDGIRGWSGQSTKPLHLWLAAGLDSLKTLECEVTMPRRPQATIRILRVLVGSDPQARVWFRQSITAEPDGSFLFRQEYRIPGKFPSLPRVGVTAETAPGFERVTWYGRGPWENYPDRNAAAEIGRYSSTVTEMYESGYILPQENGCRTDVRCMELASGEHTLLFAAETPFSFNVCHCTDAELFAARHQCELTPRRETIVHLDLAQRGVGTGSCGPQTLPCYCLDEKRYSFTFRMKVR